MKADRVISKLIATFVLMTLCAATAANNIYSTRFIPGPTNAIGTIAKVYKTGETWPTDFEVLGIVSGFGIPNKKLMSQIESEAQALGADALLGCDTEIFDFPLISTLAVKILPPGSGPRIQRPDLLITIPHTAFIKHDVSEKKARKLDDAARHYSRYFLAQRGYYVMYADDQVPDLNHLTADGKDRLSKLGSVLSDSVLAIQLVDRKGSTVLLKSSENVLLQTSIYSKAKGKVIWSNFSAGTASSGLTLNTVLPSLKSDFAIRNSINASLASLTIVNTCTLTPSFRSDKVPPSIGKD